MYLPMFPLQFIFFPGEKIPLHIFESRYRQLIKDCKADAMTFGIPVFLEKLMPYGVEVELKEIVKMYPGGEMDIVCVAKRVFQLVTFEKTVKSKMYAGGDVIFIDNVLDGELSKKQSIKKTIEELYALMGVPLVYIMEGLFDSFTQAHKIGLSKAQEYELLKISKESERLVFIEKHLKQLNAILKEVNRSKEIIELNGHFKNFDPIDFKDFQI